VATVRLPRGVACAKGDRMHLLKSRGGLGARYEVASRVCSRPEGGAYAPGEFGARGEASGYSGRELGP